jgi:diaminohydroxyphosphoribosylaminopyrimidine deaminase/5-amino-6-(5-phosphoribosylamino)uracil reductase
MAGGRHAEAHALEALRNSGLSPYGALAFVTLEPCSHHGRTPPCCDALIAAGVSKVVVAIEDPNPLVAGRGIAALRAADIEVEVLPRDHPAAIASRELNIGFFSRMVRGIPWVRLKVAASLDGTTALADGTSQWITGEDARRDGHVWRRRAGAVLTGIGTVLEDDPRLDVRLVDTVVQPRRVVVDSRLEIPLSARILQRPGEVWVYTAQEDAPASPKGRALADAGATVIPCPGPGGKVDLAAMLKDLARREVNELHVEAGHKLNGSLVRAGLVDEFLVYLAPVLLGAGRGLADIGPLAALAEGARLEFTDVSRIGGDLRVIARPPGRGEF